MNSATFGETGLHRRDARRHLRAGLRQRHLSRPVRPVHGRLERRAGHRAHHRRQHLPPAVVHARVRPQGADGRSRRSIPPGAAWRASRWSTGNGAPYTITQDIVVTDGGPETYAIDLATLNDAIDARSADRVAVAGRDSDLPHRHRRSRDARARSASPTSSSRPTTRRTATASSRSGGASRTPPSRSRLPNSGGERRHASRSTTTPTSIRRRRR